MARIRRSFVDVVFLRAQRYVRITWEQMRGIENAKTGLNGLSHLSVVHIHFWET